MAARENTALQAALIIFVLLTIGLSVSTYMSFRSAEEAAKITDSARSELKLQKDTFKDLSSEARCLRFVLGIETTITQEEVKAEISTLGDKSPAKQFFTVFEQDMARFGAGLTSPNYRSVPEHLLAALKAKSEQVTKLSETEKALNLQLVAVTERNEKLAAEAVKNADESERKRAASEVQFNQDREGYKVATAKLADEKAKALSDINTERKRAEDAEKGAEKKVETTTKLNVALRQKLDAFGKHENFEVPDGEIASVNQGTNTVLINLGSADGLRKQIMFSVYDRSENSATRAQKKAGVEITRIIDAHTSEGRIIYSSLSNPILPKDYVYSPVWHRGPRLHFALTGFMDIDGDGLNDRQLVKDLILLNGGVVDSEQQDDGKVVGKMSLATRYLVDVPGEDIDKSVEETMRLGRNSMISDSQEKGVESIYVREILDLMGWKSEDKAIQLGNASTSEQKKEKPKSEFKREPPKAKENSAF